MDRENSLHISKIYEGTFQYMKNKAIYSEENFTVYRDKRLYDLEFVSELHSRTATGELLQINVEYQVNKNWTPQFVKIVRTLGNKKVTETYEHQSSSSSLLYTFRSKLKKTEFKLPANTKAHITTPTAATSMLFIMTKRFDATAANNYQLITNNNLWTCEGEPKMKNVTVEKISIAAETIIVDKQDCQTMQYTMYETEVPDSSNQKKKKGKKREPAPPLNIFLSQFVAIPYIIDDTLGTKIMIKHLKQLEAD